MNLKFTCPTCKTKFKSDPEGRDFVFCPNCDSRLIVPPEVIEAIAASQGVATRKFFRDGGWLLAVVAGFVLLWVVIAFLLYVGRPTQPTQTAVAPAPPAPIQSAPPTPRQEETPIVEPPAPAPAPATRPAPLRPRPTFRAGRSPSSLTDREVENAIQKGIGFVLQHFRDDELMPGVASNEVERQGLNALMVYSLLHCSQFVNDPRISIKSEEMRQRIEKMKLHEMEPTDVPNHPVTYARSLRVCALSVYNRNEDREALGRDVQWLINASHAGGYQYDDVYIRPAPPAKPGDKNTPTPSAPPLRPGVHPPGQFYPDNSNSQYGLFGVWTAAESGVSVPQSYWDAVERYWTNGQAPDGTWGYHPGMTQGTTYTMTLAGITALSVTRDYLPSGAGTSPEAHDAAGEALKKSLQWFTQGDNAIQMRGDWGYALYGLERAALATGLMYAGGHDLYRELASQVIREQTPGGSWKGDHGRGALIDTSFALLFLARGRNPVMMDKLAYDGKWNNRSRDLSLLTRYCSYAMERPMNWQTVGLHLEWQQWLDAPILYIAGSEPIEFTDTDIAKLRSYANAGGLIFTHADLNSSKFNAFVEQLAAKLFPEYKLQDVAENDDLYSMVFPVNAKQYPLKAVGNGSRRLLVHSSKDLAAGWVSRTTQMRQNASRVAINLLVYASGRGRLMSRTDSIYVPPSPPEAVYEFPIARVKYEGNWDPEPYAWERMSNLLGWELSWAARLRNIEPKDLDPRATPLAHLTGVEAPALSDDQIRDLQKYVQAGGVLLIDPCGGKAGFQQYVQQKLLPALFPQTRITVLPANHPIRTGAIKDMKEATTELPNPDLRPYSLQVAKPVDIEILHVSYGKGECLIAPIDLTTGLLGTNSWNVNGYEPAYAAKLVKNIALYTASREVLP